jgi:hypothetical protein
MADPAFRPHASGLLVPATYSRAREVWTRREWKLLDKVTTMLAARGVAVLLACDDDACKADRTLTRVRRDDGGLSLQCAHKTREVIPGI